MACPTGIRVLEPDLQAELNLPRVEGIPRRQISQNRVGGLGEIDASVDGVQILDVQLVEQVEKVEAEPAAPALLEAQFAGDTQIPGSQAGTLQRVSAQEPGTVGIWIAVGVGITARENRKVTPAFQSHQRTQLEIAQDAKSLRGLAQQ